MFSNWYSFAETDKIDPKARGIKVKALGNFT